MPIATRIARRLAPSIAAAALLAATGAATACGGDGSGVLAPGAGLHVRTGAPDTIDSALVGQWFRLVYFTDSVGVRTSETTWEFRGDGTASRLVVARLLASGIASGVATNALWSTNGATLTVTLLPAGTTGTGTGTGAGTVTVVGNPPFGTTPSTADTTAATTVSFAFRVDSTTTAGTRTLYLDNLPFVFVGPPTGTATTTP
jgi:hypothetical protein